MRAITRSFDNRREYTVNIFRSFMRYSLCVVAAMAVPLAQGESDSMDAAHRPASWTATPARASAPLKDAWDSYLRALDDMRAVIENTSMFEDPANRAKAYHSLMEMQALAYNLIIAPRRTNPRILTNTALNTDIFTLGLQCPDAWYGLTFLDGEQRYRMTGRMGDVTFISILVQDSIEQNTRTVGSMNSLNMDVAKDGTFEIFLGGPKRSGNWIPLDPELGFHYVLIRRTVLDWGNSDKGELRVDRISPIEPGHYDADEFDEAAMAARIRRAETFIRYIPKHWILGLYDVFIGPRNEKNTMNLLPSSTTNAASESTSNYVMGIFSLDDDEALILSFDKAPDGAYWGLQLGDVWDRALPYYERQTSLNMAQVHTQANGELHVVISARDPGVANWLDTVGRKEGEIVLRNYGSTVASVPTVRKVKLSDVIASLPSDTKRISVQERQQLLEHRRLAVLKFFGE
jgi:hypothetical protein